MQPLQRITRFWNWLPAFRAVAETEHLPTAAGVLGVSAPGLSRTVKLIEGELGQPLFERRARRLRLNAAGQRFLEHVRDAMRLVDDGLQGIEDRVFVGPVRVVASMSVSLGYVLPAVERLRAAHPGLVLEVMALEEGRVVEALRKGDVDAAFLERTEVPSDLAVERIGTTSYVLCCGRTHPLARRRRVTLEECLAHPFIGPVGGARDAWPINLRRTVTLRVGSLALAIAACEEGHLLALLPEDTVAMRGSRLCRLPVGCLAETPVCVAHRPSLGPSDRVSVFLEAVRG